MAEPELVPQLKKLVEDHTAGSPVEPGRVWTSRSCESFSEELAERGFSVSANTVDRLLRNELGLSRRKMEKTLAMGESADRESQFQRMNQLKRHFLARGWPVLSIDTKKKELLGRFERPGQAWTDSRLQAWDHDFPSSSWGKVIPYGIYDVAANEALVYLAQGADTGELAGDAIRRWWQAALRRDESNSVARRLRRQQRLPRATVSTATTPTQPAFESHVPRLPSPALLLEIQSHRPSLVLSPVTFLASGTAHEYRSPA